MSRLLEEEAQRQFGSIEGHRLAAVLPHLDSDLVWPVATEHRVASQKLFSAADGCQDGGFDGFAVDGMAIRSLGVAEPGADGPVGVPRGCQQHLVPAGLLDLDGAVSGYLDPIIVGLRAPERYWAHAPAGYLDRAAVEALGDVLGHVAPRCIPRGNCDYRGAVPAATSGNSLTREPFEAARAAGVATSS